MTEGRQEMQKETISLNFFYKTTNSMREGYRSGSGRGKMMDPDKSVYIRTYLRLLSFFINRMR